MRKIDINENTLSKDIFTRFEKSYKKDTKNTILRHAFSKTSINNVVSGFENEANTNFTFSCEVKTLPVSNQKRSGRCWIFAGCNVLREEIAKRLNLVDFEVSQNYVAFFDKLEKCNYLMSSIMDLIDKDHDERYLMHLLQWGVSDGGQWDMFKNIVKKYGIVPKSVFGETAQSEGTMDSNRLINSYIRHFAAEAKKLYKNKKAKEISILKEKYLSNIYALLVNSFGVVPTKFDFEYVDKDNKYHIEKGLTPKSFFDKYIGEKIDEYVSLINSPTDDKPFNKCFTIDYLNNVIEGSPIKHLNVTMDRMKELIEAQLESGEIVWFGSDVGFYGNREKGVWDDQAFDYMSAFGFDLKFDKKDMLDYHASMMNHAMCLTGFNKKDGITNRYKVENSWGAEAGNKGYYVMSNSWFDQFVYQAVILKKFLSKEELKAYEEEPIVLYPWDPMGTLAD